MIEFKVATNDDIELLMRLNDAPVWEYHSGI